MNNLIRNFRLYAKILIISLISFFTVNLYAFTVDDFSSGYLEYPGAWVYGSGSASAEQVGTMLGGKRILNFEMVNGSGFSTATIDSATNDFIITNGQNDITLATLIWDGMSSPVDMTEAGASDGLYVVITAMDINPLTIIITYSDGTNISQVIKNYPTNVAGTLFFPYSELAGNANLSAITSLQLQITSPLPALDISIDLVETRPTSLSYDFGDNPDSYGTLLASGGAQHAIGHRLFIGSCVDKDSNGIPSVNADGDNTNIGSSAYPDGVTCNDDEDGVINASDLSFIDGETKEIAFKVYNQTGKTATLSGWIDFDCNGQFDSNELVQTDIAFLQTTATLSFSADSTRNSNCANGDIATYARFRLSADAAASLPTGLASDGEVEDYLVHLNTINNFSDQGDAPDAYGTTLANNGPSHLVDESLFLGSCVDSEDDGTPSDYADADDNNLSGPPNSNLPTDAVCANDEDGVINPADLSFQDGDSDQAITFNVTNDSSNDATLSGWIDFDCNGSFDASERVQSIVAANYSGTVELPFSAPIPRAEACPEGDMITYARFRLSTDVAAQSPNGEAADGEIEDYPVQLSEADRFYDQGDAPDSYGTTLANNGPGHEVTPVLTPELFMGSCVDSEADGQPNAGADGDDNNASGLPNSSYPVAEGCSNDENGINSADLRFVDGETKQISVNVTNNSDMEATLYGWIDFNCDGSFNNPDERVEAIVAGNFSGNVGVSFSAPATRAPQCALGLANTYARFRLSTDVAAGSPTGNAADGEVEDYTVVLDYEAASLGDTVWEDSNGNGLQDEAGTGIADITIIINGSDGSSVSTTTDVNGNYLFSNLIPGVEYTLQCQKPLIYQYTELSNQDAQNEGDNNADVNGNMGTFILLPNEVDMSVDCGLLSQTTQNKLKNNASLGDTVWEDLNANGQQDEGEPGVANVTITLTNSDGETITTTTDENGHYLFAELAHSVEYTAQCVKPMAYEYTAIANQTAQTEGDNNADNTGNMGSYTLASEEEELSVDCGLVQTASLGDTAWEDLNANGQQDEGEPAIAGVTMTLTGSDDSTVSVDTDSSGKYLFSGLKPGVTYTAQCDKPMGYEYTSPSVQTAQTEGDNNANSSGAMGSFTLTSGEAELSVDCGLIKTASLGDTAWEDLNGNGQQDSGEPGIAGVTMTLTGSDSSTVSATTDASGKYLFSGLKPGVTYTAQCDKPMGYEYTSPSVQTAQTEGDNNANSSGAMGSFTLTSGEAELSVDCGLIKTASLGDTAWEDLNGNGQQDSGEPGIAGVTMTLTGSDSSTVSATTDASGKYLFSGLKPGVTYTAQCDKPMGYEYTSPSIQTAQTEGDNNANSSGAMGSFTLTSGEAELSVDCGLIKTASLGDTAWEDLNGNGQQDNGEPGIAGVSMTLTGSDSSTVSATTDASGKYLFSGLKPGVTYTAQCDKPMGYEYTSPSVQTAQTEGDNNANSSGAMGSFTLTSGEAELSVDCGLIKTASLGDTAWEDLNGNGQQDSGEPGIAGVTMTLTGSDSSTVSATTDASGKYLFSGLKPGVTYTAQCDKPMGYEYTSPSIQTAQTEGDNNANSSGAMGSFTLTSGEAELSVDCGLIKTASLGDTAWEDLNGNGQQDNGEPGIAGVSMTLTGSDSSTVSATTDASGKYLFSGLKPGVTYTAQCDKPMGYEYTSPSIQTAQTEGDNNANSSGAMGSFTLTSGEAELSVDCGLIKTASLGDTAWEDLNGNGRQDNGEPGIAGVSMTLTGSDSSTVSATTNASGKYLFSGLKPGVTYTAQCDKPMGYEYTSPSIQTAQTEGDNNANSSGAMGSFTLTSGEAELSVDCGLIKTASLGDTAWEDLNGNGQQDSGEPGIAGVSMTLTGSDSSTVSATTDASGKYLFSGLKPGVTYTAQCDKPMGYEYTSPSIQTAQTEGDNNANSSGAMGSFTLTSGEAELSVDCGLIKTASLGDTAWEDLNGNGQQDNGEPGIAGVSMTLTGNDGSLATTTTGVSGNYLFANLTPGVRYTVQCNKPMGYDYTAPSVQSRQTEGDNNANSSGNMGSYTLASGESDMSIDCGLVKTASLGDTAWEDLNLNGLQDNGEPGVAGVSMTLTGSDNSSVTAITDSNGNYLFTDLNPGVNYSVQCDKPMGYEYTINTVQTAQTEGDNNADSNGSMGSYTLTSGESDLSVDCGLVRPASLGDRVWVDQNNNGQQDDGDTGVADVTITLSDNDGNSLTTVTDSNGNYLFANLIPGKDYSVHCAKPMSYQYTEIFNQNAQTEGNNNADSSGNMGSFNLISGEAELSVDCGLVVPDCSECDGKVTQMTMQYNGSEGAIITVSQKKEGEIFNAFVASGEQFSIQGIDKKDTLGTEITITVDGVEHAKIHTSCSVEIGSGYIAGDFIVIEAYSRNGGFMCPIDATAPPASSVTCGDIKPLTELSMVWNGANGTTVTTAAGQVFENLQTGNQISFLVDRDTYGNDYAISLSGATTGTSEFHLSCSDDDMEDAADCGSAQGNNKDNESGLVNDWLFDGMKGETGSFACDTPNTGIVSPSEGGGTTPPPAVDCAVCDGKVTRMTMKYNGSEGALITVSQKDGEVYNSFVASGEQFSIQGIDKKDTLGTEITITVNGVEHASIHTSCSVEIGPGFVAGDFEVTEAYSRNGGLMCAVDASTPPASSVTCGDIKPLTELSMVWSGANGTTITTAAGQVFENLQTGNQITFLVDRDTYGNDYAVNLSGATTGTSEFHLSCSDDDMEDAADCGSAQGNNKDNEAGLVNDWLFDGMKGETGSFACNTANTGVVAPAENTGTTPPATGNGDCSVCDGKVTQMTMQYNGTESVWVAVSQKDGEVYNSFVAPGEQFSIQGIDKKDTLGTEITITVDGDEYAKIHTSCSVEIGPGYTAGDFEVTEAYSLNGGLMCSVEAGSTPPASSVTCKDIKPLTELSMVWNGAGGTTVTTVAGQVFENLQTGNQITFLVDKDTYGNDYEVYLSGATTGTSAFHLSCSDDDMEDPADCGSAQGDNKDNEADLVNDWLFDGLKGETGSFACNTTNTGVVEPADNAGTTPPAAGNNDCAVCDGKVTQMTMQYNGSIGAWVTVSQKDGQIYNSFVNPGEQFSIQGIDKKDTLGTEITITVDGEEYAKIHTSCSVEIGPGYTAGDFFVVVEAYSRNGGLMCPIN